MHKDSAKLWVTPSAHGAGERGPVVLSAGLATTAPLPMEVDLMGDEDEQAMTSTAAVRGWKGKGKKRARTSQERGVGGSFRVSIFFLYGPVLFLESDLGCSRFGKVGMVNMMIGWRSR